jgi:hypothetical protein
MKRDGLLEELQLSVREVREKYNETQRIRFFEWRRYSF